MINAQGGSRNSERGVCFVHFTRCFVFEIIWSPEGGSSEPPLNLPLNLMHAKFKWYNIKTSEDYIYFISLF